MSVFLVRIDSRLIHGQIIEAWAPHLRLNCILVADDDVAADPMQKTIMRMAVPSDIRVEIGTVYDIVTRINQGEWAEDNCLLILSSCQTAREALRCGLTLAKLNIGNVHHAAGRVKVTPSVALDEEDIEWLRTLADNGVSIEFKTVPKQKPVNLSHIK